MSALNWLPKLMIVKTTNEDDFDFYMIESIKEDYGSYLDKRDFSSEEEKMDYVESLRDSGTRLEAEFGIEKIGKHFILQEKEMGTSLGYRNFAIRHSLESANSRLGKVAFKYVKDWRDGVEKFNRKGRSIPRLEEQLANFEVFDFTK